MSLTTATPADAAGLIALHHALCDEHRFVPKDLIADTQRLDWMSYYIAAQNDWQQIYLIKRGADLIGNLWIMRERTSSHQHIAHIGIALLKAHCRQGLGTRLLQRAESWAMAQHCRKITLNVVADNLPAVSFFLKHHYRFEALKKESYGDVNAVYDEYVMCKFLP